MTREEARSVISALIEAPWHRTAIFGHERDDLVRALDVLVSDVHREPPKQNAHVYDADDMRSAFIDGWLGCITHSQRHCMADDVDNAVASWREWAKSIGVPTDEGDPNGR